MPWCIDVELPAPQRRPGEVPEDVSDLDAIFTAMADCSALNPDPMDDQAGDDDDDSVTRGKCSACGLTLEANSAARSVATPHPRRYT